MTATHAWKAWRWARRETGKGCEFLGEVCWGSSGRPGHMAALGGICINFISPQNCFQPAAIKALSDHQCSRCLLSLSCSRHTHIHSQTHARTHTLSPPVSPHFESSLTQTFRARKGGGTWAVWPSELWCVCVCVFKHVCCCLCCCTHVCMCVCTHALFLSH